MSTKIEWCMNPDGTPGETWNPVVGCTRVSAGCQNCYAERMANRLSQNLATPEYAGLAENGRWTGHVRCLPERLEQPLKWRKPRRIFVNSMSDLFHEDVPCWMVDKVFAVLAIRQQHTFMVLTKRPGTMCAYVNGLKRRAEEIAEAAMTLPLYWPDADNQFDYVADMIRREPLPNVWLGVSVENQQTADERIPWLLETPAAVRFVSCEPLLGPVDLNVRWLEDQCDQCGRTIPRNIHGCYNPYTGDDDCDGSPSGNPLLDWVIAGGETGPGARPAHPDWFRGLRDQCAEAKVPFFFKKHGAGNDSRLLDGVEHNAYPEGDHA